MLPTLSKFFDGNPKIAAAFSGGVDSSYILYAGLKCGADIKPYFVKTQFQPKFELDDAHKLTTLLGVELTVIEKNILDDARVVENPQNRCYFCKRSIFSAIRERALADGFSLVVDGTNASDDADDRPGMKALEELSVRSPLRECGITKNDVRHLSKEANLFTWDKPAYACLATRVPFGMTITNEILRRVESSENILFDMNFADFRVRVIDENTAKLQIAKNQFDAAIGKRADIVSALKKYFKTITLDMEGR